MPDGNERASGGSTTIAPRRAPTAGRPAPPAWRVDTLLSEVDRALTALAAGHGTPDHLLDRARDALGRIGAGCDQLRALLDAVVSVSAGLDLDRTLRQVLDAAVTLVGADLGGLTVVGADRGVDRFLTRGIDPDTYARIGRLPASGGVLGRLITDARPIRLADVSRHPDATGLPPGHPPVRTFLGVQLRVGSEVLGALYLAEKRTGQFSVDDESVVQVLAAAAAVVVHNARLHEHTRRRENWMEAAGEITTALLSGNPPDEVLSMIAAHARSLAGADTAAVLVPDPQQPEGRLVLTVVDGADADRLADFGLPMDDSVAGWVFRSGVTEQVADLAAESPAWAAAPVTVPYGSALFVPLASGEQTLGTLWVGRVRDTAAFSNEDRAVTASFARQAALALRLAENQRAAQRLALLEDRERIAIDLQDNVIQRIFATGMLLEGAAKRVGPGDLQERLRRAVADLDDTIRDTRRTIYALQAPTGDLRPGLRRRLLATITQAAAAGRVRPSVQLHGPLDALVPAEIAEHAIDVTAAAVSNVVQHAEASAATVRVVATDRLRIEVVDDGRGLPPGVRLRGLAGHACAATQLGGALHLTGGDGGGTRLVWEVPLSRPAGAEPVNGPMNGPVNGPGRTAPPAGEP